MVKILTNSLAKKMGTYVFYILISFLFNVVLVSVFIFFHFLLDHSLSVIQEWILDRSWQILVTTKILSCLVVTNFLVVNRGTPTKLKDSFSFFKSLPPKEIFVILTFLLAVTIGVGGVDLNYKDWRLSETLNTFVFSFIFFTCDFWILSFILGEDKLSLKQKGIFSFIIPLIFFLALKGQFPLSNSTAERELFNLNQNSFIFFYFNFIFGLILLIIYRKTFLVPLFFLLAYTCPLTALFGFDPVAGENISIWKMKTWPGLLPYGSIFIVSLIYLFYKRKGHTLFQKIENSKKQGVVNGFFKS